jgi:acyl-CoA synthetase (AMP-forming)/AMP-acid ligase II
MKYFLSGGTTGTPKIVSHSHLEWREMIYDTAQVLKELGVSPAARILIGQPSFPWSIGQVFADACDQGGSTTFCFGLSAAHESIALQVEQMALTHVTLPPGLLLNWAERGWPMPKGVDLWIVGEGLSEENQRKIEESWRPRSIRRIFGCSEFGTLAYQASEDAFWLRTNPKFSFRLENPTSRGEGRLYIKRFSDDVELNTGDYASIREAIAETSGLWATSTQILFRRRASASMTLSDGSVISAEVLDALKEEFGLLEIQIVRSVTDLGDKLSVYCASKDSLNLIEIKAGLFHHVPELDPETANEATWNLVAIEVKALGLGSFIKTERGKIPRFVDA